MHAPQVLSQLPNQKNKTHHVIMLLLLSPLLEKSWKVSQLYSSSLVFPQSCRRIIPKSKSRFCIQVLGHPLQSVCLPQSVVIFNESLLPAGPSAGVIHVFLSFHSFLCATLSEAQMLLTSPVARGPFWQLSWDNLLRKFDYEWKTTNMSKEWNSIKPILKHFDEIPTLFNSKSWFWKITHA